MTAILFLVALFCDEDVEPPDPVGSGGFGGIHGIL